MAKLGSAHVSWSVRVTRTAHEKQQKYFLLVISVAKHESESY
nr:MAG TPA: hypothetical protein [Caudoviricetes sp.]